MYKAYPEQDFVDVADAIRTKTGKSAKLEFPDEFISEIEDISGGGGSGILTPAYEGLSYGFCGSDGTYPTFFTWTTKTNYMSFFEVSASAEYFVFAANDLGDRFRAVFFSEKTMSDFTQYIENPYENSVVYRGIAMAYVDSRSDRRYFYTPYSQGIIAVFTSSQSQTVPAVMGIIQ